MRFSTSFRKLIFPFRIEKTLIQNKLFLNLLSGPQDDYSKSDLLHFPIYSFVIFLFFLFNGLAIYLCTYKCLKSKFAFNMHYEHFLTDCHHFSTASYFSIRIYMFSSFMRLLGGGSLVLPKTKSPYFG